MNVFLYQIHESVYNYSNCKRLIDLQSIAVTLSKRKNYPLHNKKFNGDPCHVRKDIS